MTDFRLLETPPSEKTIRDSLVDDVEAVLRNGFRKTFPTYTSEDELHMFGDLNVLKGHETYHVRALNPFNHYTAATIIPVINTFLQRINSIFFFFDEGELEHHVEIVLEASSSLPNSVIAELCLALALGTQISNGGNDDQMIMWYENGRRYLDAENWHNEVWVIRAMALISLYHIEERMETSWHYLSQSLFYRKALKNSSDV